MRYPLAPEAVWWSLQGEGHLRGFQMAFVRLGGCSVGCAECDTDYRVTRRATPGEILGEVIAVTPRACRDRWVWITGGEPTDHDLRPLISKLRTERYSVCVATSGHRRFIPPVDWLSVSPHSVKGFTQRYGNEFKLVDGLNGLDLRAFIACHPDDQTDFMYRYVQPLWKDGQEDPQSLRRCIEFLRDHPNWALSRQDHKHWGQS